MDSNDYFRAAFADWKKKKIKTQRAVAMAANVGEKHLSDYLRGNKPLSEDARERVARAIGKSYVDMLIDGRIILKGNRADVDIEHVDIIGRFEDKPLARKMNAHLLQIESLNRNAFVEIAEDIELKLMQTKRRKISPREKKKGAPRLIKRTTVHCEITHIQAILNWATRRELIRRNPLAGYEKPKRDDEIIQPPTIDEARRLVNNAAPHLARALVISFYTGLRPGLSELLRLTWPDVDQGAGVIRITSARKGGASSRPVPLHADFARLLKEWKAEDDLEKKKAPEIITWRGKPIKRIKTAWNAAKRRAGITRRLRPYDLRHYFATAALAAGRDLKSTSKILGHSRPDTTIKTYQHVELEDYRRTIDSMPALETPAATIGNYNRKNVVDFPKKKKAL